MCEIQVKCVLIYVELHRYVGSVCI